MRHRIAGFISKLLDNTLMTSARSPQQAPNPPSESLALASRPARRVDIRVYQTELRVLCGIWAGQLDIPITGSFFAVSELCMHKLVLGVDACALENMGINAPTLALAFVDWSQPEVRSALGQWQRQRWGASPPAVRKMLEAGTVGVDCFSAFRWEYEVAHLPFEPDEGLTEGTVTVCLPAQYVQHHSGGNVRVLLFRTDAWFPVMPPTPLKDVRVERVGVGAAQ